MEDNETARQQAINNTKFNFKRSFKNLWEFLTYENIKDLTRWFLESAAIETKRAVLGLL